MKRRRNPGRGRGPRYKTKITGNDVKQHRKKLGISQKDVAKLCGLSQVYISYVEKMGSKTISWFTAKKLVSFFGGAGKDLSKKKSLKKPSKKKSQKKPSKKKKLRRAKPRKN
jgi:transcriptional regulator with XRE-family HTH domain